MCNNITYLSMPLMAPWSKSLNRKSLLHYFSEFLHYKNSNFDPAYLNLASQITVLELWCWQ